METTVFKERIESLLENGLYEGISSAGSRTSRRSETLAGTVKQKLLGRGQCPQYYRAFTQM